MSPSESELDGNEMMKPSKPVDCGGATPTPPPPPSRNVNITTRAALTDAGAIASVAEGSTVGRCRAPGAGRRVAASSTKFLFHISPMASIIDRFFLYVVVVVVVVVARPGGRAEREREKKTEEGFT